MFMILILIPKADMPALKSTCAECSHGDEGETHHIVGLGPYGNPMDLLTGRPLPSLPGGARLN